MSFEGIPINFGADALPGSHARRLARHLQSGRRERRQQMRGVITRKDVLVHSLTIVPLFGARA
jgi:hypothetical protein